MSLKSPLSQPDWLQTGWLDLTIIILVAVVEAAAIAPWLLIIWDVFGRLNDAPSALGYSVTLFITFAIFERLSQQQLDARTTSLLVGAWLGPVVLWVGQDALRGGPHFLLGSIPVVAGAGWLRGLQLATDVDMFQPESGHRLLWRNAIIIGFGLLLGDMIGGATGDAVSRTGWVALPLLLLGGLSLVTATQARLARQRAQAGENVRRTGLGTTGLSIVLLLVALLIVVLAATSFRGEIGTLFANAGRELGRALEWVTVELARAVLFVIAGIIWLLHQVASLLDAIVHFFEHQLGIGGSGSPAPRKPPKPTKTGPPSDTTILAVKVGIICALVALVYWQGRRAMQRALARRRGKPAMVVRSSVFSRELVSERVGRLRRKGRQSQTGLPSFDLASDPASVRDAYRHLLVYASRSGQGRAPEESPADYARRLGLVPDWQRVEDRVSDLTGRYVEARYAEVESDDDVARARDDWERIRQEQSGRGE